MITRNQANLLDSPWSVTSLETEVEKSFDIETTQIRNIPYRNQFWNIITYEMNQTRIEYKRFVYSLIDLLGEIGGLFGAIMPLFTFLVTIFQFRGTFMNLTSAMMPKPKKIDENKQAQTLQKVNTIVNGKQRSTKKRSFNCCSVTFTNIQIWCPRACLQLCRCFRAKQQQRMFIDRYQQVQREVQLTYVLH